MIVVDTNLIAYLFIHGEYSNKAEKAFQKDSQWAAPVLWRSEFRNVLVKCLKEENFQFEDAVQIIIEAENLMRGGEYMMDSLDVLRLAASTDCSAYDAEFVVLAQETGCPLITLDSLILKKFPRIAVSLDIFTTD
jgi:predicted nucleic acid-binding protein